MSVCVCVCERILYGLARFSLSSFSLASKVPPNSDILVRRRREGGCCAGMAPFSLFRLAGEFLTGSDG